VFLRLSVRLSVCVCTGGRGLGGGDGEA
jgi:hypothetical protein